MIGFIVDNNDWAAIIIFLHLQHGVFGSYEFTIEPVDIISIERYSLSSLSHTITSTWGALGGQSSRIFTGALFLFLFSWLSFWGFWFLKLTLSSCDVLLCEDFASYLIRYFFKSFASARTNVDISFFSVHWSGPEMVCMLVLSTDQQNAWSWFRVGTTQWLEVI